MNKYKIRYRLYIAVHTVDECVVQAESEEQALRIVHALYNRPYYLVSVEAK